MKSHTRRSWLKQVLVLSAATPLSASLATLPVFASNSASPYPAVTPRSLVFPGDFGAHPAFRTEWWYLTGWLDSGLQPIGFQVTFFRSRTRHPDDNPSRFAPQQLMFAHAALALPNEGALRHSQTSARVGPAGVSFETADTALQLSGWTLKRTPDDRYDIFIPADDFTLVIEATPASAPVLRGDRGTRSKDPQPNWPVTTTVAHR
jgi:Predicted secreted hydrolase